MPLDVWSSTLPIAAPTIQPAPPPPPPASGTVLTTFQLVSPNTGAAEFSLAVPLKKGLSSGALSTSVTNSQATVKRGWNDNSDKHVLIDGIANLTANVALTVQVIDSPGSGGTILTSGNIAGNASLQTPGQNVINLGVNGTVDLSSLLNSPIRTWRSGPWAVECHYQQVVTVGTSAIFAAFHVRLYQTGRIWIRAIVENGWVDIPNTDKAYTATITLGGVTVYGPLAITHYAHIGYSAEGWIGGDPQVTPKHNMTDLVATKLVPNYFMDMPPATALNSLHQTYTQLSNGDWNLTQGDTGPQTQIGLLTMWDSLCVTSLGDSRAFNSVIANAKSVYGFPIVWRGSGDSNLPCRPSIFPTYTVGGPGGGGATQVSAGSFVWDNAHHGSAGYLAYLLTGDYLHLETMQHQAALCFLMTTSSFGSGTNREFGGQTRAVAWAHRTAGQMVAIAPIGDLLAADFDALLQNNATVLQAVANVPGQNRLGIIYDFELASNAFGSTFAMSATFEHYFFCQAMHANADMEAPSIATTYNSVRDWISQLPVNLLGPESPAPPANWPFDFAAAHHYISGPTAFVPPGGGTDPRTMDYTQLYATWGAAFPTNVAQSSPTTGPVVNNGTTNGSLQGFSGADPATGSTSYWANLMPAIAMAVDHGVSGAAAAWNRLTGASNWLTLRNAGNGNDFASFPIFGIQPRDALQGFLATMAPGTWKAVPNSSMSPAAYANDTTNQFSDSGLGADYNSSLAARIAGNEGPSAIFNDWSGGIYDSADKLLVLWGGGHIGYFGNEVMAFDFTKLRWRRLTTPSDPADLTNATLCNGAYTAGQNPNVLHTYECLAYLTGSNKMLVVGGGSSFSGSCQTFPGFAPVNLPYTFTFDFSSKTWTTLTTNSGMKLLNGGIVSPDPSTGKIYALDWSGNGFRQLWSSSDNGVTWALVNPSATGAAADNHMTGAIQPGVRLVVMGAYAQGTCNPSTQTCAGLVLYDLATATETHVTPTGDLTAMSYIGPQRQSANGIVWHAPTSEFVSFVPGSTTLYRLTPGTWNWTANPMTGDIPSTEDATGNGVYGRFQYLPDYNCFVAVTGIGQDIYIGKPNF